MAACVGMSFMTAGVSAQVGGGPGGGAMIVPLSECTCMLPHDNDFCCTPNQTWCRRVDGTPVVTLPGTPLVVAGSLLCKNCNEEADPGCPDNPPSGPLTCTLGTKLSQTQSATATISSEVTVGVPGIEASLGAALGVTIGTTVELKYGAIAHTRLLLARSRQSRELCWVPWERLSK